MPDCRRVHAFPAELVELTSRDSRTSTRRWVVDSRVGLGRPFRFLWSATAASTFGTAVTDVALPLIAVLVFDASAFTVAALVAVEQVPWLLIGLPAGVWVDRWSRRKVLVACDVVRALLIASIPVAAVLGVLTVAQLFVVAALAGSLTVLFTVAHMAALPAIVGRDRLTAANSRLSSTVTAVDIGGRSAGGVLVQILGAPIALVVDAVSFVASALLVRRLPADAPATAAGQAGGRSFRREVAAGLRLTLGDPVFRTITTSNAVWNFCAAGQYAVTVVFLVDELRVRPAVLGVLLALGGIGGIGGALLAERLERRYGSGRAWRGALLVAPVVGLLVPAATPGWGVMLFVAGSIGLTAGVAVSNVIGGSARQALCPPDLVGRMSATSRVITWGVIPLGAIAAGALASAAGTRAALWVIAVAFFVSPVLVQASPLRRLPDLRAAPSALSRTSPA
jgi:MFS family permease